MYSTNSLPRSFSHLFLSGKPFRCKKVRSWSQHKADNQTKNIRNIYSQKIYKCSIQTSAENSIKSPLTFEKVGQPTPLSHPYLMKPGELVPGFQLAEFIERRNRFVEAICNSKPGRNHIVVIPSAEVSYMTEKIPYVFRQNSDFMYLSGCLEPESALVLNIVENSFKAILFVRENNKHSEIWEGPRTGVSKAASMFGVDEGHPMNAFPQILKSLCRGNGRLVLWYDIFCPVNKNIHKAVITHLTEAGGQKELESPRELIHRLRLIKSNSEQNVMRHSAQIASKAIEKAMSITKPGITEHQLFATVDFECRMDGAEHLAYPPVVAAGNNANIIHYIKNNQQCKNEELVLMDAGCELHGYSSDITRTWPCNGEFTDAQRTLYEIVLSVQKDLIVECSRLPSLDFLFHKMCELLGERLKEGHVFTREALTEKLDKLAFKLCPHHVSHYLGMDIHDTGTVPRSINLKEGMAITVEPGTYLSNDCSYVRPEFRGIGIRIEDDVLITSSGPEIMSVCAKDVCDIENIVNGVKK